MKKVITHNIFTMLIVLVISEAAAMAQVTWDGGSTPDHNWSTGGNWAGDAAPGNPYAGTLLFGNDGLGTNVVGQNWTVNSLIYSNSSLSGSHVTDLGGNTLTIGNGQLCAGRSSSNTVVIIRNGTLQLGTAGTPADLYAGWENITVGGTPAMKGVSLTINSAINAVNLRHLAVTKDDDGGWPGAGGCESVMDLSGASMTSDGVANKLKLSGNLTVGGPSGNWGAAGTGTLKLPASLTEIDIGGSFVLGQGGTSGQGTIDFGAGSLLNKLTIAQDVSIGGLSGKGWLVNWPSGVAVKIGTSGTPVKMLLGNASGWEVPMGSYGVLTLTNGSFEAHLSQLRMGLADFANMSGAIGILDLASCPSVQIGDIPNEVHIPDLRLGARSDGGQGQACYGRLSLPGTVTNVLIGDLQVGSQSGCIGILEFGANSQLQAISVTNSFLLGVYGNGSIAGLPTNEFRFTVGIPNSPARMDIGCGTVWTPSPPGGRLVLTNAIFSAYLANLRIGDSLGGSSAYSINGELNLTNSTLGEFKVAENVSVGRGAWNHGYLRLPSGTMNIASNLYVGDTTSGTIGLMEMHGTMATIGKSLNILNNGATKVWLKGTSAGFDLASSDTNDFTIASGAKLDVVVESNPSLSARHYWCLRMSGDQTSYFNSLTNAGLVTLDLSGMSPTFKGQFKISYDGTHTVIGIQALSMGTLMLIK